jgi:putative ABC transport system ATP-binding protein
MSPEGTRTPILDIASFAIDANEQVALRGPSGSGKTTFLHLIGGILQPDAGRIMIDGEEMTGLPESARDRLRAATLGYIFQTFNLLQGYTALENVMLGMLFGSGVDAELATRLLARVGLSNRLHYRPQQMSVGQQQRVAVARALANRPKLVLADEPTGNLDPEHAAEALGLIREICHDRGASLLLVSHNRDVLAQFGRVAELGSINRVAPGDSGMLQHARVER